MRDRIQSPFTSVCSHIHGNIFIYNQKLLTSQKANAVSPNRDRNKCNFFRPILDYRPIHNRFHKYETYMIVSSRTLSHILLCIYIYIYLFIYSGSAAQRGLWPPVAL
jgi:hypothetical protein